MKALLIATALALPAATLVHAQSTGTGTGAGSGTGTTGTTTATTPGGPGNTASGYSAWNSGSDYSLLPWTRRGYVGLNIGKPDYQGDCPTGFSCDDANARAHLYTGGFVNDWLGAELGYQYEGKADRAGGTMRAEGINLSLVLHAPLGQFHLYGKVGGLYARTKVSADALSGVSTGKETGWGSSVAIGAGFDFTPSSGVVLELARNRYRFAGDVRENIDSANIGYVHRF